MGKKCEICKKRDVSVMKMFAPSYYIQGFGIERVGRKMEVCPSCGANLTFLSENAPASVTLDQKNGAVDYFAEVVETMEDENLKKILIDYVNQEPYDDPNPEETKRLREEDNKKTKRESIIMILAVFVVFGFGAAYIGDISGLWWLKLSGMVLVLAGAVILVLPLLKKLSK